jgi:hypothetical protein
MPPSLFNNKSTERSVQSHRVEVFDNHKENESRRSSVGRSSDRTGTWPLAPIIEEYGTVGKVVSQTGQRGTNLISPSRKEKVVSFSQTVDFLPVSHLNDMSEQEKFDRWWTPRDCAIIRKMIQITLKHVQITGCEIDTDDRDLCSRGIEQYSKNRSQRLEDRRRAALEGVLIYQDYQQRWMGYVDSTFIAQVYSALCLPDRLTAIALGESDAAEAAAIRSVV